MNKMIKSSLNKDEEKSLFKKLLYISEINDKMNKMSDLKKELIKNINIFFIKEDLKLKYEEYYFNGIQTPKDIEFKDINSNYLNLFWNIDALKMFNTEQNAIEYIVELRESQSEKFIKVYEGNNNNCLINNLHKNTNYQIRICCKNNDMIGLWSKIYEIKTTDIIYKYPINPKEIKMKFNGKEYVFISHRWHDKDKYSYNKTKLAIHGKYYEGGRTPVKWLLIPDENNLFRIRYDIENIYHMMNWEVYSDETNILLCKDLSSKFEIIMLNENKFYIRDIKSGKYFYNSTNIRDDDSYFIELKNLDEKEAEKFIFYV